MFVDTPFCSYCSKPIRYLDSASIAFGKLVHVQCQRAAGLRHLESLDRSTQVMSEATPARPQKLIIVQRHRAKAPEAARASQGANASIIVDRRTAKRRQGQRPHTDERRSGRDRRAPLMEPEELVWRGAGYRIVYRKGDLGG